MKPVLEKPIEGIVFKQLSNVYSNSPVEASNVINDPKCNKGPKCNKNLVLNVIKVLNVIQIGS